MSKENNDFEVGKTGESLNSVGSPDTKALPNSVIRCTGRWIWRHKFLAALAIVILVVLGHNWLMSPFANWNPQRKVMLRGTFPFSQGFELALNVSFYSQNPACKRTARVFFLIPAAEVNRQEKIQIQVKKEEGDRFSAEFYLDHFYSGMCGWQYGGMTHSFIGNQQDRNLSEAIGGIPERNNHLDFSCGFIEVPTRTKNFVHCRDSQRYFDARLGNVAELNFHWKKD